MKLPEIRGKIDALDEQLLKLLNERADLVHEVGVIKRAEGSEIYAPEREEAVLRSLAEKNVRLKGRLPEKSIRAIYREIMSASLALEKELTIAYFGPEATNTHQAARSKFGASVNYAPKASIAEVFDAVARGDADYGVVPIENSTEGAVNHTLDVLVDSELRICAEILDIASNPARFLVIGRTASPPTGDDRTSLMFCMPDKPGALVHALEPFNRLKISISKIESRSSKGKAREYFFVDIDGHASEEKVQQALAALAQHCTFVKILGTYPKTLPT